MTRTGIRRASGLTTGAALLIAGALEIGISRADYESSKIQAFCRVGFCAEQFSLGRIFELGQKGMLGDPNGELEDFKRAVRLSPASAYRWADLSEAEFNLRDDSRAEYAISQAVARGPKSGVILTRAANQYFQLGDGPQVMRHLFSLLSDPGLSEYYETAFLTYSRLGLPIDQILNRGVPRRKDVVSQLLMFWTKVNKADEAVATWRWADELSLADSQSMADFFAFLVKAHRLEQAQQLWQDYAVKREPDYRRGNWLYNSSFENGPQGSPFDWMIDERPDVEAVRVDNVAAGGNWSLRLRFNGETNLSYGQTFQDLVLPPGRYTLTAMMKTDRITTDEGVRIHIFDYPSQKQLNAWTESVLGTRGWTKIEHAFNVLEGTGLIRVEIARQNSDKFDNKIGGTTWVDEVRLSRKEDGKPN